MSQAIRVEDLQKSFKGGVRALDGVSFEVEQGTIFGLLGPNGAGKTTVVRILTTILAPDSGRAELFGQDVIANPEYARTLFGLAGQYAAVDENLTGQENLYMVGRLNHLSRPLAKTRARDLLDQFDLADAGDRTLKTYSGGMRRRLDVAAALVAQPKVLFLDEPTTGLDVQSRTGLWGVIERLVEAGTTVLLTTQYLEEADQLASELVVIDHGKVISQGTPAELKANLGATVLDIGLADPTAAEKAVAALTPLCDRGIHVAGSNIELTVDNGPRVAMEALRLLDQYGLEPTTFTLREPSLDDVFLALTGHQAEGQQDPEDAVAAGGRRSRRRAKGGEG